MISNSLKQVQRTLNLLFVIPPSGVDRKISQSILKSVSAYQNLNIIDVSHLEYNKYSNERYSDVEAAVIFNSAECTKQVFELCPNAKWFHNIWTGCEGCLSYQPLIDSEIVLTNTKGVSSILSASL